MHFVNRDTRSCRLGLFVWIAFAFMSLRLPPLFAVDLDLVPVSDNTIYQDTLGGLSNGQGRSCFAGLTAGASVRRAVFAFDLSAIPPGSIVLSAELRLTMDRAAGFSGSPAMTLHSLTASWGEGTSNADPFLGGGNGAPATTNDATWLHRFYPTDLWTQPGGDFDPAVLASTVVPETPGPYLWGPTPEMVAVVQAWVNAPVTNYGWILRGNEQTLPSARRFHTREALNPGDRPHLFVTYTTLSASELPPAHALRFDPAAPNPFNPSTTLRWDAPTAGLVRITVWDARGAVVSRPLAGERLAGPHSFVWQARDAHGEALPSGVYIVRLEHGGESRSQRVVLVR